MKRFFLLLLCLSLIACASTVTDLDILQKSRGADANFKKDLVQLHNTIETSRVPDLAAAFNSVMNQKGLPVDAKECVDGVYTGTSPYDVYAYCHTVQIEIKNERIVSVDYNEKKADGHGKQEDKEYCEQMIRAGTSPDIAYPNMEKQLEQKQNIMQVEGVS